MLTFALELKDGVCILQAGDGSVTCFIMILSQLVLLAWCPEGL